MPKRKSKVKRPAKGEARLRRQKSKLLTKKLFSPQNIRTLLGLFFVILGLLFLYKVPVIKSSPQNNEPIAASSEFKKLERDSSVVRILIPKHDIDLTVTFSKIKDGYWELSETTASHGEGSANPGERGNTVIFAHARQGLFYNLKNIDRGDIIYVLTKDNWHRYKVSEIKAVYPNQVETIAPTNNEILTLFTCSGFFDEKRLIVKALPENQ
jgi:LPXTG-site transpeptidase (sortase) family protein